MQSFINKGIQNLIVGINNNVLMMLATITMNKFSRRQVDSSVLLLLNIAIS